MKKKEQFVKIKNLSVSKVLFDFINDELLKGIKIKKNKFLNDFSNTLHELNPINKNLIEGREKIQKTIDSWHLERKGKKLNLKEYKKF